MALSSAGKRVAIVDLDRQASASKWADSIEDENIIIEKLGNEDGYDVVFYDTPPALSDTLNTALTKTDIAVVVSSPTPTDVWSSKETTTYLEENFPDLKKFLLFNRVQKGQTLSEERENMANIIGIPPLDNHLAYYSAYQKAPLMGWKALKSKDSEPLLKLALEILTK